MSVVLDLPFVVCIWISTAVAVVYTLLGGLYSVAYTDVIQLLLMFISLVSHLNLDVPHVVVRHLTWCGLWTAVSLSHSNPRQ